MKAYLNAQIRTAHYAVQVQDLQRGVVVEDGIAGEENGLRFVVAFLQSPSAVEDGEAPDGGGALQPNVA